MAIHDSFWLRGQHLQRRFPRLAGDHATDVLVIGGGISGLSAALELLHRGYRVTVCEANVIGAGTTGGSSGHVDAHPEMGPSQLLKQAGERAGRAFVNMRLQAIDAIEQRSLPGVFHRVPAYQYTEDATTVESLRDDLAAAQQLGLQASWTEQIPMAGAIGGYRLEGMGRLDCYAYLRHLADLVQAAGGEIYEETLVHAPTAEQPTSLQTSAGEVRFQQVISAVHCNGSDSQRLYLQTPAYQSYVLAAKVAQPLPDVLLWDNASPYHYIRRGSEDGRVILVGGCDHRTGVDQEPEALMQLEGWLQQRFEVQEIVTRWSAELFEPPDGLPFIGQVAGKRNVWVATGLSGVGLTLGTAAGAMLADLIQGQEHPLQELLSPARTPLGSVPKVLAEQMTAAGDLAERILPHQAVSVASLQPGEGSVGKVDGKLTAVCRDQEGCLHQRSPICTHMGGVVRWNPVEQTWDCPVHGGRFTADGKRLYGPPEEDLGPPQ